MNEELNAVYNYAIRLLAKKDYSKFKLTQKLLSRDFDQLQIENAINLLEEKKFLNESEYIRQKIKSLLNKNYSDEYIVQKLELEKLFPTQVEINSVKEELGINNYEMIDKLIRKKIGHKGVPKEFEQKMKLKQKIFTHLYSKGYTFEEFQPLVEKYIEGSFE